MSRTSPGFESFQMPSYSEGSSALSNRVQDLMPRNFSKSVNELPSSIHFAPEIYGDGWKNDLPAASSEQIKSKLDSASGIVFSSAADNVENKVEPDFYLGEDGKLRANPKKTAPNEDGSVNIELQTKNKNESDAIKYSDQMQKAAVKDLINYFRQSNPNGRVPQHWLDMLSKEPDLPPAPAPISVSRPDVAPEPTQPTKESPRTQTPQAERTSGGAGGGSGGGGGGGGSGGGNRGGGEGNISRSGDTSAGPDVNLNASVPKAMQIMDYFVEKGLTPQQAAGITGNLQRESLLNPGITEGGGGGGYGLAQWTGERRQELETFAATAGQPASDLKVQLDFLWKEMNSTETGALQAFKADPNMSAAEAAKVFCEKFERPGVVAMNDRTSGAEQFFAAYKNGGDQGATAVNAPAPTEFNEHLVAAVKQQDAAMSGTGKCATAVQRALAACGLPEFLGSGNGGEMDKPLLASGKFTQVSINDAKPGDIIVRPPSANPNDTSVYGDVSVVTARNGDNITQTNDATYQFKKDNPRYDGKATFLRYTG